MRCLCAGGPVAYSGQLDSPLLPLELNKTTPDADAQSCVDTAETFQDMSQAPPPECVGVNPVCHGGQFATGGRIDVNSRSQRTKDIFAGDCPPPLSVPIKFLCSMLAETDSLGSARKKHIIGDGVSEVPAGTVAVESKAIDQEESFALNKGTGKGARENNAIQATRIAQSTGVRGDCPPPLSVPVKFLCSVLAETNSLGSAGKKHIIGDGVSEVPAGTVAMESKAIDQEMIKCRRGGHRGRKRRLAALKNITAQGGTWDDTLTVSKQLKIANTARIVQKYSR